MLVALFFPSMPTPTAAAELVSAGWFAAAALLITCSLAEAKMRVFRNKVLPSTIRGVPLATWKADQPLWNEGFIDVTRPPYSADPGLADNSSRFQDAIDDAFDFNFVVYVPGGTYAFKKQLLMRQTEVPDASANSQRKFAHIIVGQKGARPVLALTTVGATSLTNNTSWSGLNAVKDTKTFLLFEFWNRDPDDDKIYDEATDPPREEPMRHYNATLRNIAIDMGNNPGLNALSMAGAQYCVIEDVKIFSSAGAGGMFAAGIRNLPGSGGSSTNVQIIGGKVGIRQDQYRPTPLVTGLDLVDQSEAGVVIAGKARGPLEIKGFGVEEAWYLVAAAEPQGRLQRPPLASRPAAARH